MTIGLILAGGRSHRFGRAKAEAELCGASLAAWVLGRVRPQVAEVIVSVNGPLPAALSGLIAITDTLPGLRGPLAGILAGLEWIARYRPSVEWCASFSVDVPFLPMNLVTCLESASRADGRAAVAASGGRMHPVAGLWPVTLAPRLRRYLVEESRSDVAGFAAAVGARTVEFPDAPFDPFFNINTGEDLARAEQLCAELRLTPNGHGL